MEYEIISSRKFRDNMKEYLDMADQGQNIFITRRGGRVYRLGVPSQLPSSFEARTKKIPLCQHKNKEGECQVMWCKFNANNQKKNPPVIPESSNDEFDQLAF